MTQESYEMSNRLSHCGPVFTEPEKILRDALYKNDYIAFEKIADEVSNEVLEHVYQYPDYKTCLEIAVSKPGKEQFVKFLLQRGVKVNKLNERFYEAPIHLAVANGNLEGLKALLDIDNIDINIKKKGNKTALLMAIQKIEELQIDRENYLTIYEGMIELLLKKGSDVNTYDSKGVTPIYSASNQGLLRVVTLLLDHAKNNEGIDLDTFKDRRGKTSRHIISQKFPNLLNQFNFTRQVIDSTDNNKLFSYLYRHDEENFVRDFKMLTDKNKHHAVFTAHSGMNTMLELATEKGLEKVVDILLTNGADPNDTHLGNTNRPIAIACRNGFATILEKYISHKSISLENVNGDSLIQITICGMRFQDFENPKINYNECLKKLLKTNKIDVNHRDVKKNTALHYAARNGDEYTILALLRNGGCIGLRNCFNIPPVADISAQTLENYLNECITIIGNPYSNEDYEIHINFNFLVYPNNTFKEIESKQNDELVKQPLITNTNNDDNDDDVTLVHETEALLYMAKHENLKQLLKHPVITSFLDLKWQRISYLFYGNIIFYFLLCLCLILYIIIGYCVEKPQSGATETLNLVTRNGTIIGLFVLILRELFQILVTPVLYMKSIENWMEIIMIIVTTCIVCYDSAPEYTKRQLSAVAILFSSIELVLLVSHFPILSTYIVMLRTVSLNFLKFILWYCILILAFALSFYTLLRDIDKKDQAEMKAENKEPETNFFNDLGSSIFKTIVMLTGEFETGSIKFDMFPWTSHILFIIFVFLVPIVLFNLLNGLAVSDIQAIKADAEIVGQILLINMISYFESLFIANSIKEYPNSSQCFIWPSYLQYWHAIKSKLLFIRPLARRISLFPHFIPKYEIIIKPNDDNKIEIPGRKCTNKCRWGCFARCLNYRMDADIIENAKIVDNKKKSCSEFDEIKKYLKQNEKRLKNLENSLNILCTQIKLKTTTTINDTGTACS